MKSRHVLRNLNAGLRRSTVTNGGYTGALNTVASSQERVEVHSREMKEYGQIIRCKNSGFCDMKGRPMKV